MNRYFILVFVLLSLVGTLRADEGRLYSADNLSSTTATCVIQDSYGFVWTGTEYGLNRFDGYQFVRYYAQSDDTTSLFNNEITTFFIDSHQQFWIGCRYGLMRYDYKTDSFRRYVFQDGEYHRVSCLIERPNGTLLVGTASHGLYEADAQESSCLYRPSDIDSLIVGNNVNRLWYDDQQTLWIGGQQSQLVAKPLQGAPFTLDTGCGAVMDFERRDQRGFVIACMHGILWYDYQHNVLEPMPVDLSPLQGVVSISKILFDQQSNLWVGTSGMGLMVIPKGRHLLEPVTDLHSSFDLSSANVNDLYEDRTGNLWVTCYKRGLFQVIRNASAFATWSVSSSDRILGSAVKSIAPDAEGQVLCVVQKSALYRFDSRGKLMGNLHAPESPTLIYRDSNQRYWLGTESALYRYYPETERYELCIRTSGLGINCITDDGDNRLFFAADGQGLCCYNIVTGEHQWYSSEDADKSNRLLNNWIRALCYDSRHLLWIGTVHGLACFDPNSSTPDFSLMGWTSQFSGQKCYALEETHDGNILIGLESGLYCYDRQENQFRIYSSVSGLRNQAIYSIIETPTLGIWMTTPNSILHVDNNGQYESFSNAEGLDAHEFAVGARIMAPDGRIFFGNSDGITAFYPHNVQSHRQPLSEVFLTSIIIDGRRHDCRQRHFDINREQGSISLEFSMLDFRNSEHLVYQYRLSETEEWITLTEGVHSLSLGQLSAGQHTIQVRTTYGLEDYSPVCEVILSVHSSWYQTRWAYLLSLVVFLLIGLCMGHVAVRWRRLRRLRRQRTSVTMIASVDELQDKPEEATSADVVSPSVYCQSIVPEVELMQEVSLPALAAPPAIKVKGNDEMLLLRITSVIHNHLYDSDFNVERLITEAGISRAHLHRKMKELTGESPADYIRRLRLEEAKRLIAEGKINITQIAYTVGFNNQTYFSTVFHKYFGMTPSEYAATHGPKSEGMI